MRCLVSDSMTTQPSDSCIVCGSTLSSERAAAMRDFFPGKPLTCVSCSRVQAPLVLMDYSHKTAGVAFIVPTNTDGTRNAEADRRAMRVYKRSR